MRLGHFFSSDQAFTKCAAGARFCKRSISDLSRFMKKRRTPSTGEGRDLPGSSLGG